MNTLSIPTTCPTWCLGLHHDENLHLGAGVRLDVYGGTEIVLTPIWRFGEPQPRCEVSLETDGGTPATFAELDAHHVDQLRGLLTNSWFIRHSRP